MTAAAVAAVPALPDIVTVLHAKGGKLLTKRWVRSGGQLQEISYERAWLFSGSEYRVSNVDDLGELIRQISGDPHQAVVRGTIAEGADRTNMLRRARPREGIPATLIATPRWWLGLDLDDIPCPLGTDPLFEPDAIIEHTISLLPTAFHDVTCLWQRLSDSVSIFVELSADQAPDQTIRPEPHPGRGGLP